MWRIHRVYATGASAIAVPGARSPPAGRRPWRACGWCRRTGILRKDPRSHAADPETASAVTVSFNSPLARVWSPLAGPLPGSRRPRETTRDGRAACGAANIEGSGRPRKSLHVDARDDGGDGPPTADTLPLVSARDGGWAGITSVADVVAGVLRRRYRGAGSRARAELASDEVGHVRAARIRPGDRLLLIDGAGNRWEAELVALDRRAAICRAARRPPVGARPPVASVGPRGEPRSFPVARGEGRANWASPPSRGSNGSGHAPWPTAVAREFSAAGRGGARGRR